MKNIRDTKLNSSISKQQYQALLKRIMDRQASPNVLQQMQPQGMDEMPQAPPPDGGGLPLGQQVTGQTPNPSLAELLGKSQDMWDVLRGGPGEELWNIMYQMNPEALAAGSSPEEYFHRMMTSHLHDKTALPDGDEKSFLDTLASNFQQAQDPTAQAYQQALMRGFNG